MGSALADLSQRRAQSKRGPRLPARGHRSRWGKWRDSREAALDGAGTGRHRRGEAHRLPDAGAGRGGTDAGARRGASAARGSGARRRTSGAGIAR